MHQKHSAEKQKYDAIITKSFMAHLDHALYFKIARQSIHEVLAAI